MKNQVVCLALAGVLFACSGETKTDNTTQEKDTEKVANNCTYTYNAESAAVLWEAYKFTNKAAVVGKLEEFTITNTKQSASAIDVFKGASIEINTSSVNSKDITRDKKLVGIFFAALNTPKIVGEIKNITQNTALCSFTLNGITKDVQMNVAQVDVALELSGEIDLGDFNGGEAVKTLNAACNDLHTGSDGVSKLWPTVSISFVADLDKACD